MREHLKKEESILAFKEQKDLLVKQIKLKRNIKKKVNKVKVVTNMDKILHRSTGQRKRVTSYYTEGHMLKEIRDVLTEESPYKVPETGWFGVIASAQEDEEKEPEKHYLKQTYRGKSAGNILSRVYIPQADDLPLGMCDYNPDYFTLIKGRPTKQLFRKDDYVQTIKSTLYYNLLTSVYEDKLQFHESQYLINFQYISSLYDYFDAADDTFKAFLYADDTYTLDIIETYKTIYKINLDKFEELEAAKNETMRIQNDVQFIWDRLLSRRHCKDVLLQISPSSWQKQYEEEMNTWRPESIESYNELIKEYQEYLSNVGEPDPEVAQMVESVMELFSNLGPQTLYFKHISQVEDVFTDIEEQGVLAMQNLAALADQKAKIKKLLLDIEKYYDSQKRILEDSIDMLEKRIDYNVKRTKDLNERLNKKADTWFKDTIIGEETIMVKSLVECMYDEIVGTRSRVMTNHEMMEELESVVIKLWMEVSLLDPAKKKMLIDDLRFREEFALNEAKKAKIREQKLNILLKMMTSSYQPAMPRLGKPLKPRSNVLEGYDRLSFSNKDLLSIKKSLGVKTKGSDLEEECTGNYDPMSYFTAAAEAYTKGMAQDTDQLID